MTWLLWIGFVVFVLVMLALDLGVLHKKTKSVGTRQAIEWTGVCIGLALVFNALVYFIYKHQWFEMGIGNGLTKDHKSAALVFFTGYIVELSLSLDNIFVVALIFSYFAVPREYQHRTLLWGIIGALVMRGAMIAAGTALIRQFEWIIYVFGALLILTAVKMFFTDDEHVEPEKNILVRIARKLYPVSPTFDNERFFTQMNGKRAMTPLFLVLLVIESTDVLFAVDSIPAVFAITQDPFIVFTSNVFAILCLRSMFFALSGMMDKFRYLKTSLVIVLAYVGVKMLLSHWLAARHMEIPTGVSLLIIAGVLGGGVVASLLIQPKPHDQAEVK